MHAIELAAAPHMRSFSMVKAFEYSMLALFLYDYLLTLPREVEVMWRRILRISNAVYFTLRYLPVVYITYAVIATPVRHCTWVLKFILALTLIMRAGISATLTARTYAICRRRPFAIFVVAVLGLATVVLDVFQVACVVSFRPCGLNLKLVGVVINISTRILFEVTVIVVTLVQAVQDFSMQHKRKAFEANTLPGFVLKSGMIYFASAVILETCGILITTIQLKSMQLNQTIGAGGTFPGPVEAIIISRFLLNLRCMNRSQNTASDDESIHATTLLFANAHAALLDDFGDPSPENLNLEENF